MTLEGPDWSFLNQNPDLGLRSAQAAAASSSRSLANSAFASISVLKEGPDLGPTRFPEQRKNGEQDPPHNGAALFQGRLADIPAGREAWGPVRVLKPGSRSKLQGSKQSLPRQAEGKVALPPSLRPRSRVWKFSHFPHRFRGGVGWGGGTGKVSRFLPRHSPSSPSPSPRGTRISSGIGMAEGLKRGSPLGAPSPSHTRTAPKPNL